MRNDMGVAGQELVLALDIKDMVWISEYQPFAITSGRWACCLSIRKMGGNGNCPTLPHWAALKIKLDKIWEISTQFQMIKSWPPGSVDWVLACEPKGYWFSSQSGHIPELWARSPAGGMWEAAVSLSRTDISLHFCLLLFPSLQKLNK